MQALNPVPTHSRLSHRVLSRENAHFSGTGGISQNNRAQGFRPAFLDTLTGRIYLSCFADGRPAPIHLLDGLPAALVVSEAGQSRRIRVAVISGFVLNERFYSRAQAAEYLRQVALSS
ncbi:hypothetical protein [Marinobacterium rhizophilum]|uniref:Uncharacterized protein n=1 Tax=Marinobacterium rhizophilum TaxID=420402 RepID=A0ABY5HHP1_9GAMM|nr:hypothetical protein [Marinobacterium rhizophilum]UTW11881.1 hypothetical protein KDW95_21985 [Marinobacterium rhizophilum]